MEQENDVSRKIKALHTQAGELLKKNYADEQIIAALCNGGISEDYARTILENVYSDLHLKKESRNLMISGIGITIMGLTINIYSYLFSENTNQTGFLLFWGIVVAGILMIIRAISVYKRIGK